MPSKPGQRRTEIFIHRLLSGDVKSRRKAAIKLGHCPCAATVRHLCNALQDSDRHVRGDAAKSLGAIGDVSAVPPLIQLVESDTSVGAIRRGVRSLGQLADSASVSALLKIACRSKGNLDTTAREAIDAIGLAAVGELSKALTPQPTPSGREAVAAIGRLYRNRRPPIGTFTGGVVIEAIMTSDDLGPEQRFLAVEAALTSRLLYRTPDRISADAAKLCNKLASQHRDNTIRTNAESVINYRSLGRPSHVSNQPAVLLRAAGETAIANGAAMLVRPADNLITREGKPMQCKAGTSWRRIVTALRGRPLNR